MTKIVSPMSQTPSRCKALTKIRKSPVGGGNVAGVVEKTLKVKTRQLVMTSQNIDKFRQLVKVIMTDAA